MPDMQCILCGTNSHSVLLYPANVTAADLTAEKFSARRLPDRIHEEILRCSRCGLTYPRQLIDTEMLSSLYQKSTFTYDAEASSIRKTYARYLRRATALMKGQPHPWSYLDIGCGNGFMLGAAHEIGFDEVLGVEPSAHAISLAEDRVRPKILQGMFSEHLLAGRQFDLISCFQTLDHIADPVTFIRDCARLLKPGGRMLCINHNIASWTARILGERCPMIDIEHTFLHTPRSMRLLFEQAGFSDMSAFSVRNDYPLYVWLRLIPLSVKVKAWLIALTKRLGMSNLIIPFYPGNLGLIAVKGNNL
ncbi:MAG: class I SAM-dependent methyltransferase [Candidatus Peregrinibacteria bacterium]